MKLVLEDFIQKIIVKELTTSHLEKKVDISVVPVQKLNKKMKESINKAQGAQFLKDAEYIIGCVEIPEIPQTPAEKEEQKEKNKEERAGNTDETPETTEEPETKDEETPTEDNSTEDNKEKTNEEPEFGSENTEDNNEDTKSDEEPESKDDADNTEDDNEDEKKEDKDVNESVTVQDLTSKMLVSIKTAKTSTPKKSTSVPAKKCEGEKKLPKKTIEEAETEATGDVLRGKFQKALTRIFGDQDETNKIELYDVRDVAPEGTNVYYAVITFKEKNAEEEN